MQTNYADIKQMHDQEKDPAKQAKLKETLACMEEAAANRGIKPQDWTQATLGVKPCLG